MSAAPIPWKHVRNILVIFAPLWLGAAVVFGFFGVCYGLFRSETYSARLPLLVRSEASTSMIGLGRFNSQTEMKAAQETILEMTQSPEVVGGALGQIGPPSGKAEADWPSTTVIDAVSSGGVNLLAPQGSDFGNSEVVYLSVKAENQDRAFAFCNAMFDNLAKHLRTIRHIRADSVIGELTDARDLAAASLNEAASRMQELETQFPTDLGELRNLSEAIASEGTNRRTLETTEHELQTAELELNKLLALHQLMVAGSKNPDHLLVSGSDLLTLQPSLLRLKDGLIDAQIISSRLAASRTEQHPSVVQARATEKQIRRRMQDEAASVVEAMKPLLNMEQARVTKLSEKRDELNKRLEALASVRTEYAIIDAEVSHRTTLLEEAERALAEAHASRKAALSTDLVAKLGPPQVSDNPLGPGGTIVAIGSTTAGLLFGLGTVFLIAPGPNDRGRGRRWTDFLHAGGRRTSDRINPLVHPEVTPTTGAPPSTDRRSKR